jgi:predicted transcriptional regulator
MASEILKLTVQIVMAHASMSELSPDQLIDEIKEIYNLLSSLEGGPVLEEPGAVPEAVREGVKKPSVPLKDIVQDKYVVCLECGKKMKTLKAHLRKAHNLTPKEYFRRFGLDPKKYPLVCRDYSAQRSRLAKERGLGALGRGRKTST